MKTRRTTKKDIRKAAALVVWLTQWAVAHKGKDLGPDAFYRMAVPTVVGTYRFHAHADNPRWIWGRFDEPKRAAGLSYLTNMVNAYSGKANHYASTVDELKLNFGRWIASLIEGEVSFSPPV
jgi:hypothetical protein